MPADDTTVSTLFSATDGTRGRPCPVWLTFGRGLVMLPVLGLVLHTGKQEQQLVPERAGVRRSPRVERRDVLSERRSDLARDDRSIQCELEIPTLSLEREGVRTQRTGLDERATL